MDKDKKKKAVAGAPKAARKQSDYKSREDAGKISKTDVAFHKASGPARDGSRKG